MNHSPFICSRRDFLRSSIGACAPDLYRVKLKCPADHSILDPVTGHFWQVKDPVEWSFQNVDKAVLARARNGLRSLLPTDSDRIQRLLVRRCGINLIRINTRSIEVQYWGNLGLADLRPFVKHRRLGSRHIKVVLIDRKREQVRIRKGADFLYGSPIQDPSVVPVYIRMWDQRHRIESGDWGCAPCSNTAFGWRDAKSNGMPWMVLKGLWRQTTPEKCPNCDLRMICSKIDSKRCGISFRPRRAVTFMCSSCCRVHDFPIDDTWFIGNLDMNLWPEDERLQVDWKLPFFAPPSNGWRKSNSIY